MQKKSLELCLYVLGGGAFGVFIRWLQLQIAFDEAGLVDKSALNIMVVLYILAAAWVYLRFVDKLRNGRWYAPDDFTSALSNSGKLYSAARWGFGGMMVLGALVLFATCETEKEAVLLRVISLLALLSGVSFPVILSAADSSLYRPRLICTLSVLPSLMFALWLIACYKTNDINSVVWAYSIEIITVCVAMVAFFRTAGFAFSSPNWGRALFFSMMGGCLCIMSLADARNMGLQIILIASALMLTMYVWVIVKNMAQREAAPAEQPNDGFERL